jgi:hypothetical protein
VFINQPWQLKRILNNPEYEITDLRFGSDTVIVCTYWDRTSDKVGRFYNTYVASFCTSYARLHLLNLIELDPRNTLYMDTDSLAVYTTPESPKHVTGHYFGDLTSVLPEGDSIVEFVSCGPKTYAYKTRNGLVECKCKGISLSSEASKIVDFDCMVNVMLVKIAELDNVEISDLEMAARLEILKLENHPLAVNVPDPKLQRLMKTGQIFSQPDRQKILRFTFDQRRIVDLSTSYPYGYRP